jgi:hypothetical protein
MPTVGPQWPARQYGKLPYVAAKTRREIMEKRYRALRIISTVYKILGAIVGGITALITLATCATSTLGGAALDSLSRELGGSAGLGGLLSGAAAGVFASLFVILWGGGIAVMLYGMGEYYSLLIDLEENTRATAALLRRDYPQAGPST